MCMVDDYDRVELLRDGNVIARKEHKCRECHRVIKKGETCESYAFKHEGDFDSGYCCIHCCVCKDWLIRECAGYLYSEVEEDLRQHWYEDGIRTYELGRLIVGMKEKWTTPKGKLMKVPKLK